MISTFIYTRWLFVNLFLNDGSQGGGRTKQRVDGICGEWDLFFPPGGSVHLKSCELTYKVDAVLYCVNIWACSK